jgi:hypothetical protein
MPCYQVQECNCELKNADQELLAKGLQDVGYETTYHEKQKQLSFSKGEVVGFHKGDNLHIEAPQGTKIDVNEIRRSYSQQVVNKKAAEFEAKGWTKTQVGNKVAFTKPRVQQKVQVGFQR